jgi:hypothetical protein
MATTHLRTIDWVQQDLNTGALNWRQIKRAPGQYPPEYSDRRITHSETVVVKKATKTKPEVTEEQDRYTEAEQKRLRAIFEPLVRALKNAYGNTVQWWHFDHSGLLLYSIGGNERSQALRSSVVKIAEDCFEKFSTAVSKLHGHPIVPRR